MRLALSLVVLLGFSLSMGVPGEVGAFLNALWEDVGCQIDPLGGCSAGTAPGEDLGAPSTDEGCMIDPWGGCDTGR